MGHREIAVLILVCAEAAITAYVSLTFWITVAVTTLNSAGAFLAGVALIACASTLMGAAAALGLRRKPPAPAGPIHAVLVASALLLGLCLGDSLRSVLSTDLSLGGVGLLSAMVIFVAVPVLRRGSKPSATPA